MARSVVWSRGRFLDPETANDMLDHVSEFLDNLETLTQQHVPQGYSAPLVRGSSGRPRFSITEEQLRFLIEYNFSTKQMADILCVSRRTVKRRLREFSISLRDRYTDLSDSDLDNRVREVVGGNDELGAESVWARLAGQGIVVQRHRVRQSLIRANPVGAAQRVTTRRLHRRVYQVAGPNSLWHLDGNHKLIRWRIVIHGGIDGYSRLVVFLKASSNNRSDTVFHSFVEAIGQYGLPSRVRCDNGGENNAVCLFMNVFRGFTRGSALRGRSTHNQRIERLWRDVWRGISNTYYALFMLLESEGIRGILGADEEPVADVNIPPASEEVTPQDFQTIFNWPESVEIPANHFNIQGGVMEQLVQQVNPLGGRPDDLGTDLLEQVINFLGNIPQRI
ncbi:hypothetical protein DPX16_1400 [Anabarilius grahami]|uniref:Integrase catalytic domain-containing protein n=1 Tax=Anabarilius grahami TaxID=495550 RepID=A0A3N0XCX3_ANAGA|nr:hypothetical protein DPX16_1400 [Anabarilius grahami]